MNNRLLLTWMWARGSASGPLVDWDKARALVPYLNEVELEDYSTQVTGDKISSWLGSMDAVREHVLQAIEIVSHPDAAMDVFQSPCGYYLFLTGDSDDRYGNSNETWTAFTNLQSALPRLMDEAGFIEGF